MTTSNLSTAGDPSAQEIAAKDGALPTRETRPNNDSSNRHTSTSDMSTSDRTADRTADRSTAAGLARASKPKRPYWLFSIPLALAIIFGTGLWWLWPPTLHGLTLELPRATDDFTLQTSAGEPMSLSDFRGQFVLLFFGYTYCPDVCPMTMNDLAAMADELGERRMQDVQVIFVSVDPQRDTPEHLANFLPHFHPDFLGMTGTVEEIQPVASQFGIFFESHGGEGDSGYLVDHSTSVTLIDPQGRVRMVFPYGVTGPEIASDLQYLMRSSFRF